MSITCQKNEITTAQFRGLEIRSVSIDFGSLVIMRFDVGIKRGMTLTIKGITVHDGPCGLEISFPTYAGRDVVEFSDDTEEEIRDFIDVWLGLHPEFKNLL